MVKNETSARTDSGMEHFGYKESLARSIGSFGSFAAGVSYISILTGTFQLFYFGFGTAGPAYLWSWPLVLIGQLAVALCFIVIIDANSLRQHVGKQAAAINRLAKGDAGHSWLRERMGHTVVEICGGLTTGIAMGHVIFALFGRG